jgi:sugar lactone lactonase YvrE
MMQASLEVVVHDRAVVAESPMWSIAEKALYWLDGRRDAIYRLEVGTGARSSWAVPSRVNALALAPGGLIVAMKSGISLLDVSTGTFAQIADAGFERTDLRMNDGKVDRAGRFWYGTMHEDGAEAIGIVARLASGAAPAIVDRGFTVPNGFAWSPDDRRMYLADTRVRTIYVYDYDIATGEVRDRRAFVDAPPAGAPDGATVDAAGYLWSACTGGFALARYAPDGSVDRVVDVPVERPTSVVLGGDDLRTLFITTATRAIPAERLAAQPLAGAVLALRVDVPGLPEPAFRASPP